MHYFALIVGDIDPLEADKTWFAQTKSQFICPECSVVLPEVQIPPIVLSKAPSNHAFNFVYQPDIEVVRLDFLSALGDEILSYVQTGPLLLPDGREIQNFQFIYPKKRILIRGGPKSDQEKICSQCGRVYYWPRPFESEHLLRPSVASNQPIYGANAVSFVIQEPIARRLRDGGFKHIQLYELPVLDEPQDGFPADMPAYAPVKPA